MEAYKHTSGMLWWKKEKYVYTITSLNDLKSYEIKDCNDGTYEFYYYESNY